MRQAPRRRYSWLPGMVLTLALCISENAAVSQSQTGTIEGKVKMPGAALSPLPGAHVKARAMGPTASPQFSSETTTDGAGNFIFREVPPGLYVIEVSLSGYGFRLSMFTLNATRSIPVTVTPGQRTQVPVIELTPAGTIAGHVLDNDGKGWPASALSFFD